MSSTPTVTPTRLRDLAVSLPGGLRIDETQRALLAAANRIEELEAKPCDNFAAGRASKFDPRELHSYSLRARLAVDRPDGLCVFLYRRGRGAQSHLNEHIAPDGSRVWLKIGERVPEPSLFLDDGIVGQIHAELARLRPFDLQPALDRERPVCATIAESSEHGTMLTVLHPARGEHEQITIIACYAIESVLDMRKSSGPAEQEQTPAE